MENIQKTVKYMQIVAIVLIAMIFSMSVPTSVSAQYYDLGSNYTNSYDNGSNYYNTYDNGSNYNSSYDNGVNYNSSYDLGSNYNNAYDNGSNYYNTYDNGSNYNSSYDNGVNYNSSYDLGSNYTNSYDNGSNYNTGYDVGSNSGNYYDQGSNYQIGYDGGVNYNSPLTASVYSATPMNYSNQSYYNSGSNIVSTGGYSGGYDYYGEPSTYYYGRGAVVISGGFHDSGNQTMPSTYNAPLASNVYAGGYYDGDSSPYYNVVQPTYYYSQPQIYPNQVLAYTDTNPNLDSVYLSDIPSTGFDDYYGVLMFISILVSWSAILAYIFLKRKISTQTMAAKVFVENTETNNTGERFTSNFIKQNSSDKSDMEKVEEYARTKKVLLSSDATAKIVKLSRLGKLNASDFIRGKATGEWIAIGENQIVI